jgi:hypothetical protein
VGVFAAAASMIVVVAVIIGSGGAVRPRPPASPAGGSHPGRRDDPVGAQRSAAATHTTAGGSAYCVNSITHARTACSPRMAPLTNAGGFPVIRPHPGSPERLVAQLHLQTLSGAKRPTAIARVVEQGGAFGVTIVGAGLSANTKRDAYAVWLTNGRRQSKLLGFVDPAVKINGRLKTAGILPKDAFRYHELLITLETQAQPPTPGAVALQGSFHR